MARFDYFTIGYSEDPKTGEWGYTWTCSYCSEGEDFIYKESGDGGNSKEIAKESAERSIQYHKLSGSCKKVWPQNKKG